MNPAEDIERTIKNFQVKTTEVLDKRILEDSFAALQESICKPPIITKTGIWQMILTSRFTKLAAVAAVILAVSILFLNQPSAKVPDLADIYQALQDVENICVSAVTVNQAEPYQQFWLSQTLRMGLFKTEKPDGVEFALWDFPNKIVKIKNLSSDLIKTETIPKETLAGMEKSIDQAFGLVPFPDLTQAPASAQWQRVEDPEMASIVPGTEVYDLTWPQKSATLDEVKFVRWRVFVDTKNNLPKKTEYYSKVTAEDQFQFESSQTITYTTEGQIRNIIYGAFGPESGLDQPEYIGTPGQR